MSVQARDFIDLAARSRELGCRVPVKLALLPGNFSTAVHAGEFCFHAATPYVRSAWQDVGLGDEGPDAQDMTGSAGHDRNSPGTLDRVQNECIVSQPDTNRVRADIPLAVFFGSALSDGSAWRVAIALGMVSSVLASDSRRVSPRDVQLDIVVERPGGHGYTCIEYRGDAFGIVALTRDVRRVWADDERPCQAELSYASGRPTCQETLLTTNKEI